MSLPGMQLGAGSDFVTTDFGTSGTFIRFISRNSLTDDHNGRVLAAYLQANNCAIGQHRPRSMTVQNADLIRLFL